MQPSQHSKQKPSPGSESTFTSSNEPATISSRDLEILTELVLARFPSGEAEAARISEIRRVLAAASEVQRALEIHTHCVLVDHRGTQGFNDLRSASRQLLSAFDDYTRVLRKVSDQYQHLPLCGPIVDHDRVPELRFPLEKVGGPAREAIVGSAGR